MSNQFLSDTNIKFTLAVTGGPSGFTHTPELLEADSFEKFKENGIFNKETANSFRNNILSKGNTEHPMNLYVKFRGREPKVDALLKKSGLT